MRAMRYSEWLNELGVSANGAGWPTDTFGVGSYIPGTYGSFRGGVVPKRVLRLDGDPAQRSLMGVDLGWAGDEVDVGYGVDVEVS